MLRWGHRLASHGEDHACSPKYPDEVIEQLTLFDSTRWMDGAVEVSLARARGRRPRWKADVCGRNNTGVVCMFSDGSRFRTYQYVTNEYFIDSEGWDQEYYGVTIRFADIDNDDHADVCGRSYDGVNCARALTTLNPLPARAPLPAPPIECP